MIQPSAPLPTRKSVIDAWLQIIDAIARAMIASEISDLYFITCRPRAEILARVAIGEMAMAWNCALLAGDADPEWHQIGTYMAQASKLYVASMESILDGIRRGKQVKETALHRRDFERISTHWADAILLVHELYKRVGGHAQDIPTINARYQRIKESAA